MPLKDINDIFVVVIYTTHLIELKTKNNRCQKQDYS